MSSNRRYGRVPQRVAGANEHIATSRKQLGFFWDYVQSVPYLGYRFKA